VVDLRTRTAFAAGHVTGTLNVGLDGQLAAYLGWLIPWGTPVTLLGETPEQVAEAQRELVRIGIDRLEGSTTGTPRDWTDQPLGSFARAKFADLTQVRHHRDVPSSTYVKCRNSATATSPARSTSPCTTC